MFHLFTRASAAAAAVASFPAFSGTPGAIDATEAVVTALYRRDDDDSGEPHDYVRWVFIAVVVVVVVAILISFFIYARRRRQMMRNFWSGEGASDMEANRPHMGLFTNPRTHRHARGHGDYSRANGATDDVDPVPAYHAAPGDGDMGVYDSNGNYTPFEPPPYEPPKAALRPE